MLLQLASTGSKAENSEEDRYKLSMRTHFCILSKNESVLMVLVWSWSTIYVDCGCKILRI